MEESKRKSSRRDEETVTKRSSSNRDRDRDRDGRVRDKDRNGRDRDRESRRRDRETSVDDSKYESRRDREKSVDDSKYRDVEKPRDKHRDKDKDREERKSRDKDREDKRVKEKEREREREKERERRERKEKEKERERKEREREKEKERERKEREREKERERKERDRYREREKRRDRSNSGDEEDVVREKEKKRRRRDDTDDKIREGSQEIRSRSKGADEVVVRKERTREEDMAEEQKILDDEIEKRRKRVQEWQERKRKEESEREKNGVEENKDEVKSGKAWTLDGESDDEENAHDGKSNMNVDDDDEEGFIPNGDSAKVMDIDSGNGVTTAVENGQDDNAVEEDEIDPLDAYMNSMVLPEVENLIKSVPPVSIEPVPELAKRNGKAPSQPVKKASQPGKKAMDRNMGRIIQGEDSDSDYEESEVEEGQSDDENDEQWSKRLKKTKVEKLSIVDHTKIDYPSFRKNFYTEVKEIKKMTPEEVAEFRVELELKIHGKDVPKPIKSWHQTGLSTKVLDIIRKLNFEKPMSIQAQALPIIMSGRDCIGIAKTGSGKTLAFVLPMLRHIKDQAPLMSGDGPIGLIMAPTRELVKQIYTDIKKFTKGMGLTCVPIYGGSGVAQQISDLKRGAEIVVCTPGRMIDILCTSAGKITNLRRVTYLVMDEADRMFDMGFEPQITRIVQNTRPDRQTVLFSATFPRQVETLARKVLNKPVEIQVGGRSVVNKDITQLVELRPESDRFNRLLELLGEWYEKGKVLIFVHTQDKCDSLFKDLLKSGYPCLSLHGAKDQTDRESTLADFKSDVCNLMVATSVAARGLDVKDLELVINFDAPNHYEDYVHRVGRTGRAGRKGCAITFISEDDARYAPDLVKALELSEQSVPADLKALADSFNEKVNQGQAQAHGTGYGGTGYKFNQEEEEAKKAEKKAQYKSLGYVEEKSDSEDDDDGVRKAGGDVTHESILANTIGLLPVSLPGVPGLTVPPVVPGGSDGTARAVALAAAMNLKYNLSKIQADAMPEHYEAELEINDFPQNARWKVTHKDTLGPISEWTGAAITTRGQYHEPGKIAGPGDRKLYLFIEGPTEQSVKKAKAELKRVLEDITTQASSLPGSAQQPGRYSVI